MRTFERIKASNILSFGPDGVDLELHDLNVLIGVNGSGKSNFLEMFALLQSLPKGKEGKNLHRAISDGGGIDEWIWKGNPEGSALIEVDVKLAGHEKTVHHLLEFKSDASKRFEWTNEEITEWRTHKNMEKKEEWPKELAAAMQNYKWNFYNYRKGANYVVENGLSVLSVKKESFPFEGLNRTFDEMRLYREWQFGRQSIFRKPQPADGRNDILEENFSNLGLFLSKLGKFPKSKKALVSELGDLYEGLSDYFIDTKGNTVQVFFTEGDFTTPATRLSDGSLRYLCLLAILLDPTPPPLICIEEPELGLHPDLIPKLANVLVEASARTQLVVTTHSDILIDALSEYSECVLVCEKHDGATCIKRLKKAEIEPFLEKYRLGQLWGMGEIGGNRW